MAIVLILWSVLMLWLCWEQGVQQDYRAYLGHWRLLLNGADPWSTNNAYGPLYTILGFLLPYGSLAPKLFMVTTLLLANAALVFSLLRERGLSLILLIYVFAILTNVLTIGVGVIYGLNDALVVALLVAAVIFRFREHFIITGALIGSAALVKYYPLLLLPFFALNGRRLHWSLIVSGMATFVTGMALALAVWGDAPLHAIVHGGERKAKLLSIFSTLKKLRLENDTVKWLRAHNAALVVSGVALVFLTAWRAGRNWIEAAVLGYLVMLTLYKVGHQQFYLPWLFMIAALPLLNKPSADRMAIILMPAVLLLSLYHFGYEFASDKYSTDGYGSQLSWVRGWGGLIAFSVSVLTVTACVIDFWRHRRVRCEATPVESEDRGRCVAQSCDKFTGDSLGLGGGL